MSFRLWFFAVILSCNGCFLSRSYPCLFIYAFALLWCSSALEKYYWEFPFTLKVRREVTKAWFPYDRPGRLNIFFETTQSSRTIRTIRTIIWKPGLRYRDIAHQKTHLVLSQEGVLSQDSQEVCSNYWRKIIDITRRSRAFNFERFIGSFMLRSLYFDCNSLLLS